MIEVQAGKVHRDLGWKNRVASVCTTLESRKFQKENHLFLIRASGPASGRSTTVSFAFGVLDPRKDVEEPKPKPPQGEKLKALYGLCAKTFRGAGRRRGVSSPGKSVGAGRMGEAGTTRK